MKKALQKAMVLLLLTVGGFAFAENTGAQTGLYGNGAAKADSDLTMSGYAYLRYSG